MAVKPFILTVIWLKNLINVSKAILRLHVDGGNFVISGIGLNISMV